MDRVERKKSIRRLTEKYCENYKTEKLQEFKKKLDDQKQDFLKEKVTTLEWLRKEEIECGIEPTVSESDINEAKEQLSKHLETLKLKPLKVNINRNILSDM